MFQSVNKGFFIQFFETLVSFLMCAIIVHFNRKSKKTHNYCSILFNHKLFRSDMKTSPESVLETSSLENSPIKEVQGFPDFFKFPDTDSVQPFTETFIPDPR